MIKANAFLNVCSKNEYQNQNQSELESESVDCPLVAELLLQWKDL